jgi:DNA-binding NtrC family response regulator
MGQPSSSERRVAVVNTSQEIVELLQGILEDEGFIASTAYVINFKRDAADLHAFLHTHRPQVVLWDIALPYEENWRFFQDVARPVVAEYGCDYVLMTTNKTVLERMVGSTDVHELVGKPFDIALLLQTVRRLLTMTES